MELVTLEEYKAFVGATANPKDDARISLLIASVSSLIQAYLGLDFTGGKSVTEVISLDYNTDKIFLKNYPVSAPVTVTETDRYTWDSSIHVPLAYAGDYVLDAENGMLTRIATPGGFANWPISPGVITVTYTTASKWGGFGAPTVPADLKLAAIELINYYKNDEFRQNKTTQGTSLENTLAQGTDFPKHIQVILDRYK
jgi:hypothetical protein